MRYLLSVLSVLSAPVVYGLLCVPTLGWLYGQFPDLLNAQGGTDSVPLLLVTELLQFVVLALCGYVVAWLAPLHRRHHVVIATGAMLLVGVSVQLSFWEALPVWHHWIFFACIVGGMHLGAFLRARQLPSASAAQTPTER